MGATLLCELGLFLLCTLLCTGHTQGDQDAVLTIEPSWSSFFIEEFVTFKCDMNEGEDTDWEYKINKDGREFIPYNTHKDYSLPITTTDYSGEYQCSGRRKSSHDTKNSSAVSLTVLDRPRATLTLGTTIIPVGGSVTLNCSVDSYAKWKYEWFRRTQRTSEVQIRDQKNRDIRVSQGGIYRCRGTRGNPVYNTDISDDVTIEKTQFLSPAVETTCVRVDAEMTHILQQSGVKPSHCQYQKNIFLTDKPRPVLTVSPSWLSPGASVTLNCEVEHPSAGWSFYWYKAVPDLSEKSSSYELLPDGSGTAQDSYIIHGQTHTAGYVCRAGRGDPEYHTDHSQPKFVWVIVVSMRQSEALEILKTVEVSDGFGAYLSCFRMRDAVLTIEPNWSSFFIGESVTFKCDMNEGEDTDWHYQINKDVLMLRNRLPDGRRDNSAYEGWKVSFTMLFACQMMCLS
ncbi:uncharacterized protein LOC120433567 [Oreochromis aureus]|uniref:uncharacterized protein LOC120433567 n=1 Tax=Oreochromis aureus TaxID=47969 RepID=UPI0019533C3E|nr:uncharacterized protein LOC120433567 [Oreochromis aureus]